MSLSEIKITIWKFEMRGTLGYLCDLSVVYTENQLSRRSYYNLLDV